MWIEHRESRVCPQPPKKSHGRWPVRTVSISLGYGYSVRVLIQQGAFVRQNCPTAGQTGYNQHSGNAVRTRLHLTVWCTER